MKTKKQISILEWKERFLKAYEEGEGHLPRHYPYNHWASWLRTGKACPQMYEGWLQASNEYERIVNES